MGAEGALSGYGTIDASSFQVSGTFNPTGMTVRTWDEVAIEMADQSTFQVDFSLGTALTITGGMGLTLLGDVTLDISGMLSSTAADIVLVDGSVSGWFSSITTNVGDFDLFSSSATEAVYTFEGNTITLTKDDVKLYMGVTVPEPTTWALMIGGMGALALLRRRRRA